jgi:hypothetical protein
MILDVLCIDILYFGRERFEGFPYNICWSSQYGDRALIGCVLIGTTVLQRSLSVPVWSADGDNQCMLLVVSGSIAVIWNTIVLAKSGFRLGTTMDTYHNFFIVPLFVFLLGTMLPVTFQFGSATEKIMTASFVLFWIAMVWCDLKTKRLNQPKWLIDNGFGNILTK